MFKGFCYAQDNSQAAHFQIRYVINRPEIDSTFIDNAARLSDMREFLLKVRNDSLLRIASVEFCGTASPDGGYEFNQWLSASRLETFKEFVNRYIDLPDSLIKSDSSEIPWDRFREKVAESDIAHRDEVLEIIDEGPSLVAWYNNRHIDPRLLKLKRLYNGQVWESLKSPILRDLRFGSAVFEYYRRRPNEPVRPITFADSPLYFAPEHPQWVEVGEEWTPRLHLKTNIVGLAMLNANFAVEGDIARHWSVTFPIYYCGMDWFKSTIKFRNFTIQPEVRYWPRKSDNDGFFMGAHFELSYYNFAFDGKYRYQDHRGRTPALGGGLSAGYRLNISNNQRWRVEFSVGAGIYPLDYDIFDNTPDIKDGVLLDRNRKLYIGLDQVAVTLAYSFDLERYTRTYKRKGVRR